MAYNKAREERKWRKWKEKEERQLRIYGMDEASIQELWFSDWKDFNADRRFWEHYTDFPEEPEWEAPDPYNKEVTGISDMLDCVSDERILRVLLGADRRTLQILLMKVMGFSVREISKEIRVSEQTIYTKITRLKKKIKKFSKK